MKLHMNSLVAFGLMSVSPLACAPTNDSNSSDASSVRGQTGLSAAIIEQEGILTKNIETALSLESAERAYDGKVTGEKLNQAISCEATKKSKWGSALFHNPNAKSERSRTAQSQILGSGLYSSAEEAKTKLTELLSGGFADGTICLGKSAYNFSLELDHKDKRAVNWVWGRDLEFTGTKRGAAGYSSTIKFVVSLAEKTVQVSHDSRATSLTFHYVSKLALVSSNGDQESWNLVPTAAAEKAIHDNTKAVLEDEDFDQKDGIVPTKQESTIDTTVTTCKPESSSSLVLNYSANVADTFPSITIPKTFSDENNYIIVEVVNAKTGAVVESISPKNYFGSQALRKYTARVSFKNEGAHLIRFVPVFNGNKARESLELEVKSAARRTSNGGCRFDLNVPKSQGALYGLSAEIKTTLW